MNTAIELTENSTKGLSCQDTPFITNDGIEIMPPYDTVDGIDPTCFTHDGKEIPYKSTNYYKYHLAISQHQKSEILRASIGYPPSSQLCNYDTWIIQQQQQQSFLEKPILARDTCMNDLQRQPLFEFGNLSESSLNACSSYDGQESEDKEMHENMVNKLLEMHDTEPDYVATSLLDNQLASSTMFESPKWLNQYPRVFRGRVSVLQNPKSNIWSVDDDEGLYDNIYEPNDAEIVDMCKLNMLDTVLRENEWTEINHSKIKWVNTYDWVNRLFGHPDFELFKDLLEIDTSATASTTCFSQYSDCFESNDEIGIELFKEKKEEVLPQVSEDGGPIAKPKPFVRLI